MANKDTILTIYDSDIISESMHKINYNFELLLNKDDVSDWKLSKLEQKINNELDNIRRTSDERASGLSRDLDDLEELLKGLSTHEEIQAMVNAAITNAESTLRGFISTMAGEQISEMVSGFAKTADLRNLQSQIDTLNGKIEGLDGGGNQGGDEYVSSQAFTQYKSDAEKKMASANMMAANSTFKKDEYGYYILFNDDPAQPEQSSQFKSLVEYYQYLRDTDHFDPNGLGLSDPDICKEFLKRCETYFQSVFTELAQFRASVSKGEAVAEVLASIRGDNDRTIVAAIFARANEEGSHITMNADHIELDASKIHLNAENIIMSAEHRLALVTGGFTINSENLVVDLDGNVQMTGDLFAKSFSTNSGNVIIGDDGILHAQGAEISGDLNALTLTTANGNTKILSDGTLVAKSANISGEITAQSFSAESSYKEINTSDGYSGNVKKNTTITGEQFSIIPEGILKNSDPTNHPDIDLSKNSLYIEIIDELDNPDTSIIPDSKLYGVPVLCMVYKGKTYRMSPGAWLGNTAGDTSTMRFILRNNYITHLTLNALDSTNASKYYLSGYKTLSGTNIQYYFFRPEDKPHTNNRSNSYGYKFIDWGIGEDSLYQFDVLNWGGTAGNSPSNITWSDLKNTYGLISSYDSNAGTEVGSYVLGSTLGKEGLGYAGTGGDTVINSKKCGEMSAYLPDSQKSIANKESRIVLDKSWIQSNTEFEQYSVWGCKGIVEFMKSLLLSGGVDTQYAENPIWKTNYFSGSSEDTVFFDRSINGKLPFDENSNGTFDGDHMVEMSYAYYPVYYINKESGKYNTLSNGSDKVLTKITVKAQKAMLTKENSNRVTVIRSNPSYFPGAKNSETMHILHFGLEIEFYVVLDFRGQFIPMSSSVQDDTNVVGYKVKEFFTNFNFSSLKSEFSDDKPYSNFFKVTGTLYCEPEDTTSGCYITLIDNYS